MNNIEKFKLENNVATSELLFDIPEPSEHQCPNIDAIKQGVSKSYDLLAKGLKYDDIEDVKYNMDHAVGELYTMDYDVEDIRKAIMDVREWGYAWKELCKQLINDLPEDVARYHLNFELEEIK